MSDDEISFATTIGPRYASVDAPEQPLFVAAVERAIGDRYRQWARETDSAEHRTRLRECAAREVENADTVEHLFSTSAEQLNGLRREFADVEALVDRVIAGRSRTDQMRALAEAERTGGILFREFASAEDDPNVRRALLACANREDETADALQALVKSVQ